MEINNIGTLKCIYLRTYKMKKPNGKLEVDLVIVNEETEKRTKTVFKNTTKQL